MISIAPFQGRQGGVRACSGQSRADDYRNGMLAHDPLEEGQTIHPRHLDVEGDDVGYLLFDALDRRVGIGRHAHDFNLGVRLQDYFQDLADRRRIIDDQYFELTRRFHIFVGRTPWPAADPLVGLLELPRAGPGGPARTRASALPLS